MVNRLPLLTRLTSTHLNRRWTIRSHSMAVRSSHAFAKNLKKTHKKWKREYPEEANEQKKKKLSDDLINGWQSLVYVPPNEYPKFAISSKGIRLLFAALSSYLEITFSSVFFFTLFLSLRSFPSIFLYLLGSIKNIRRLRFMSQLLYSQSERSVSVWTVFLSPFKSSFFLTHFMGFSPTVLAFSRFLSYIFIWVFKISLEH